MKINILILLCFCIVPLLTVPQTNNTLTKDNIDANGNIDADILNKYWYYRFRLRNDFLSIGDSQGQSIPSNIRNYSESPGAYGFHRLNFGDSGLNLGWYIGVLATEYVLLKNNQDWEGLEMTKTELYYALKAHQRLDYTAEMYPPWNSTSIEDGYYIRDDVYQNFVSDYSSELNRTYFDNYGTVPTPLTNQANVNDVRSDFEGAWTHNQVSKDQLLHGIMGWCLVLKYVDNSSISIDLGNGTTITENLWSMAEHQYRVAINRLDGDNWILRDPAGAPVTIGASCYEFSFPIVAAYVTHSGMSYPAPLNLSGNFWQPLRYGSAQNAHDRAFIASIGATSNGWHTISGNKTYEGIKNNTRKDWWEPFYLKLYMALHNINLTNSESWDNPARVFLSTAPCGGTYFFGNDPTDLSNTPPGVTWDEPEKGWKSAIRFANRLSFQENGGVDYGFFSGLDYMLLHNLYYLTHWGSLPYYHNMILAYNNDNITSDKLMTSFESYELTSVIEPGNKVVNRAGLEITLKPGFHAKKDAEYHGMVHPYDCSEDGVIYTRKNRTDTIPIVAKRINAPNKKHAFQTFNVSKDYMSSKGLEFGETQSGIQLFTIAPNPSNGNFSLYFSEKVRENATLIITNFMGALVYTKSIEEGITMLKVDLTDINLTKGVYLVSVRNKMGVKTEKLTIID